MSIFHSPLTAPSRRRRVFGKVAELVVKISGALLITFMAAGVLLRAEPYLAGLARTSNGALTAAAPDEVEGMRAGCCLDRRRLP